jgi:hypothetical protein
MSELELYAQWESSALTGARLRTVDGRDVIVVSRGRRNDAAGPDYLDAVLVIAGRLTVGAVEMHEREADWFAHGHQSDPAYSAVILHVVRSAAQPLALAVPTVLSGTIGRIVERISPEAPRAGRAEVSRRLLAESAWTRLLRRVTEIVRCDDELPLAMRLERAFVRRYFDALGYAANRHQMRRLAAALLEREPRAHVGTFDAAAALLFGLGGCDPAIVRALGAHFMDGPRIERILAARADAVGLRWTRATRPANVPERRLWAAARMLIELERERKLPRLVDRIASGAGWRQIERDLVVRFAGVSFIGESRASEIVMNALLPVALAAGVLTGSARLIERACALYRTAPAQESNRPLRAVEARYLGGRVLDGGFWQQGAIELHQRYLSADRSALTYIAERPARTYRLTA